jgi:hypothetical protein
MAVMTLASVKGSPGVTTAAAALVAAAVVGGQRALLVELDPSGGDVRLLSSLPVAEPNLVHAAAELRYANGAEDALGGQAVEALPSLPALLAPAGAGEAEAVLSSIGDGWGAAFRSFDGLVVVDAGRWDVGQATTRRIEGADVVGLVVRATAVSVEHARHTVVALRRASRAPVAAVVVGDRPHPPEAVAAALDLPLAGSVAWDPRGVGWLWAKGATSSGVRSSLARSAGRTLAGLEDQLPARHAASAPDPADLEGPEALAALAAPPEPDLGEIVDSEPPAEDTDTSAGETRDAHPGHLAAPDDDREPEPPAGEADTSARDTRDALPVGHPAPPPPPPYAGERPASAELAPPPPPPPPPPLPPSLPARLGGESR